MKDYWIRALKTFIQAFFGILVPEIVGWLSNLQNVDWSAWHIWLLPVVGAALAGGISAVWNYILETKKLQ